MTMINFFDYKRKFSMLYLMINISPINLKLLKMIYLTIPNDEELYYLFLKYFHIFDLFVKFDF